MNLFKRKKWVIKGETLRDTKEKTLKRAKKRVRETQSILIVKRIKR